MLAILHTWPLATAPGRLSRNDNNDAQLNEWIMAWVAHQLPRAPSDLFDANIFFPARHTLAFSEPLIVPALLGAPVAWAGGSPVLVTNLMVIAGFALTAFAGFALVLSVDRRCHRPGCSTGATFAFNTHTLTRLAACAGACISTDYRSPCSRPIACITTPRTRDALWLALWMAVLAYTSGYLVVFAAIMVATALLVRAARMAAALPERACRCFALAAALAAVAVAPLWLPYHARQPSTEWCDRSTTWRSTPRR